jgi:hypothetical protein
MWRADMQIREDGNLEALMFGLPPRYLQSEAVGGEPSRFNPECPESKHQKEKWKD